MCDGHSETFTNQRLVCFYGHQKHTNLCQVFYGHQQHTNLCCKVPTSRIPLPNGAIEHGLSKQLNVGRQWCRPRYHGLEAATHEPLNLFEEQLVVETVSALVGGVGRLLIVCWSFGGHP